jgi:Flp pilus assembly protein TadB
MYLSGGFWASTTLVLAVVNKHAGCIWRLPATPNMCIIQKDVMDKNRLEMILRSALVLTVLLVILLAVFSPLVTAFLLLAGAGAAMAVIQTRQRRQKVIIEKDHYRPHPPGRSPPFFS